MSEKLWFRFCVIPLLIFSMLLVTGCSGCGNNDEPKTAAEKKKEEEEKKKKKPKPNFYEGNPVAMPGIVRRRITQEELDSLSDKEKAQLNFNVRNKTKPGHWVNVELPLVANNYDAAGTFVATPTNSSGKPIRILGTDFYSHSQRQVSLPKDNWKHLETTVYLPKRSKTLRSSSVEYTLTGATGLPQHQIRYPHTCMHPSTFHMVVLTSRPDSFKYINKLDCIEMPNLASLESPMHETEFYKVVIPDAGAPMPLSRNALTWTTIAYLVWDDVAEAELDARQQKALLDWLHFGGQLILSGPDCLDKFRNDGLIAPYLPVEFEKAVNLNDEDFGEINENWALRNARANKLQRKTIKLGEDPILGVEWQVRPGAKEIDGTGGMVVERMVGRGRIVVTRFPFHSQTPVVRWPSFSSFFHGCLLRKPPRRFTKEGISKVVFEWAGEEATSPYDPLLGTTLRFLSRDLEPSDGAEWDTGESDFESENFTTQQFSGYQTMELNKKRYIDRCTSFRDKNDSWHYGGYKYDFQSGVGGWDDYSGIPNAARESLRSAAGIDPPSPEFVLKMLSIYLLVLVPLNWVLFRIIGKVEWAWIAAPIIAIVGAFLVVKLASLDIGFARSQTRLSLLEMHGDYERGHLSEYSALYTSLSDRYSLISDNTTALSLPFGRLNPDQAESKLKQTIRGVKMSYNRDGNRMDDFLVQSNFTDFLHTEMIHDTGGVISLNADNSKLGNSTVFDLSGAGVIRKVAGKYQLAWVGDLGSGQSIDLNFRPLPRGGLYDEWYRLDAFKIPDINWLDLWNGNFKTKSSVSPNDFKNAVGIPKLGAIYEQLKVEFGDMLDDRPDVPSISKESFRRALDAVIQPEKIGLNLGAMLKALDDKLQLANDEYRLIGYTESPIGENDLNPRTTQVQRLTMVVVHLKKPRLPRAKPDVNHWNEMLVESDLDYEFELQRKAEAGEDVEASELDDQEGDETEVEDKSDGKTGDKNN